MRPKFLTSLMIAFIISGCAAQDSGSNAPALISFSQVQDLVTYTEGREVCLDRNANRNAYFGDLHIHTGFSYDARPFVLR